MASGSFDLGTSGYLQGKIDWSSLSNGSNANSSNVTARLYARRTNDYTTTGQSWSGYVRVGNAQTNISFDRSIAVSSSWVLMATVSTVIGHNSNGVGSTIITGSITGPSGTALAGNTVGRGQTVTLDTIPRYASITHSLNSTGLNNAKINWSSNSDCDLLQYSLNNGTWTNVNGNPYTVSGLNPNTNYKIKTRVRRRDSQLYSQTEDINFTTKDIGKITSVNNFEHGNNVSLSITNPSSASLSLVMKIGNMQIFNKNISVGTNTISFTDTQLDIIYKLYKSSSSLTATFILTTAGIYTNSRTCTITLKGNQKTIKENVNGIYKRGKVWINVNENWKRAIIWTNINGNWKRGI